MFLLLIQSTYNLFFDAALNADINMIDVIIRTATASIFGYFLSSNFMRHAPSYDQAEKNDIVEATSINPENTDFMKVTPEPPVSDPSELYPNNHLQIIVTTAIAIFCLFILTVVRNSAGPDGGHFSTSALATISQFRDLISGCIGFLIGAPTTKK